MHHLQRMAFIAQGVKVNEQGYIIVEGRDKDQINRGGEKVAEEVENHLLAHDAT